jgi:hypothetical protein
MLLPLSMQNVVAGQKRNLAYTAQLPNRTNSPQSRHWSVLFGGGVAFSIIGFTDVLLLWYPLAFGSLDWEFATLSGTFDALPLATIGMVMMGAGSIALRRARTSFVLSLLYLFLCIVVSAAAALFLLAVLAGMSAVDPSVEMQFRRAVTKTSVLSVSYILLYGWLAWIVGRAGQPKGESA